MKPILSLVLFVCTFFASIAQNGTEPMLLTDMLKIKNVGNITVTKDGSKAAFTVTTIEPDETNKLDYKYVTQIYSFNTASAAAPVQLTRAKEGASQPSWSPDGKSLAFVRAIEGKPQIFILSAVGGEAMQLTKVKQGASNPKWSPDGKKILFSSSVTLQEYLKDTVSNRNASLPAWPLEKPGIVSNDIIQQKKSKGNPDGSLPEVRAWLNNNEADKKAIVLNKLNFQNESNISSDQGFNRFFVIAVEQGAQPTLITKDFYRFTNADFTPDGKKIIISGDVDSLESPDRSLESEIFIADADGRNMKMLLGAKNRTFGSASVSPNGKWLAFQTSTTSFVSIPVLAVMSLSDQRVDSIPFDRSKGSFAWSQDEKFLYFTSSSNGGNVLYHVDMATKKVERLSDFDSGINSYGLAGNKILYAKTNVSNPSELFMADQDLKNEKQISNYNNWVKNKKLSFPVKKKFTNEKGMEIEYWLMKPSNYKQGQKYPLLLEIHGGPSAMWGPGEASMWHEYQYFCSKGYGVVYSNPRGSGGYGLDFLRGNVNDWGAGPSSDVLTALDKAVAEGWADTSKLLITGGSYAGYLTTWIISHDNRFKAACSQRGVYDLLTFFGEGNAWRLVPNYFGGYPWEPKAREVLIRESPINYVERITTPLIIFHGANDRRTGFVQGEMLYRSLKVLGRPVEYVVHPGATHEITRSGDNRQRLDQMLRTYEFFERWIR